MYIISTIVIKALILVLWAIILRMIKMFDALMKRMLTSCLSNVDQYYKGTGILEGYNISSSRAVKVVRSGAIYWWFF
jgi:hypothetical protein